MYAVKIYYTNTDGDNELEVELVHNKREALRTKEAYERSSYGLGKIVPDLSYLNKIEIEKQSNFNYKWLLCSMLIVLIPVLIIKVFFGDIQKKSEVENRQVHDQSNYITQEMKLEDGKEYEITVISSLYVRSSCAMPSKYPGYHDYCLLIVEYDNAQRYLRVELTGKKKYTSALNIQKMKAGERYIIYEKDEIVCVKSSITRD